VQDDLSTVKVVFPSSPVTASCPFTLTFTPARGFPVASSKTETIIFEGGGVGVAVFVAGRVGKGEGLGVVVVEVTVLGVVAGGGAVVVVVGEVKVSVG